VIDNEAGMEHLSRRTTRDVQHLLIVSDPTQRGLVAAGRIASFRNELDIRIENAYLILNRLPGVVGSTGVAQTAYAVPPALESIIQSLGIPLLGIVPANEELARFETSGRPLVELGNDSPVYQAVAEMMGKIL